MVVSVSIRSDKNFLGWHNFIPRWSPARHACEMSLIQQLSSCSFAYIAFPDSRLLAWICLLGDLPRCFAFLVIKQEVSERYSTKSMGSIRPSHRRFLLTSSRLVCYIHTVFPSLVFLTSFHFLPFDSANFITVSNLQKLLMRGLCMYLYCILYRTHSLRLDCAPQ
jgi:hypothetical protein